MSNLTDIAAAIQCHAQKPGAVPAEPVRLADIDAACLSPSEAARLVDPLTGAAYAISYPDRWTLRVCATFERPAPGIRYGPGFDAGTGCLTQVLGPRPPTEG
jgi:hypothetical protein